MWFVQHMQQCIVLALYLPLCAPSALISVSIAVLHALVITACLVEHEVLWQHCKHVNSYQTHTFEPSQYHQGV